MTDRPSDLARFVTAQAPVYPTVLRELRAGRKRTHWMWFIFPQLRGLGRSDTAQFYALANAAEARAYHAHPILGPRLIECTEAVLNHAPTTPHAIFGTPDDLKFRSCITLFAATLPNPIFAQALSTLCQNHPDPATLALLTP